MKQVAEEFIKSLRGKVSAEGEKVLDLIAFLVDNEEDKRKHKVGKQGKEIEIDTPFSDYKIVEVFGTKMVAPNRAKCAAIDSDGQVYLYPQTPLLIEADDDAFAFFGAGALRVGKVKNLEAFKSKQPCELCVELKEVNE